MNGKPAVQFNGNSNLYVENFNSLSTDDYTILVVSQLASASGHQDLLSITDLNLHGLLIRFSGGKWRFFIGCHWGEVVEVIVLVLHLIQISFNDV